MKPVFDPYDLWCTSYGVKVKNNYYQGKLSGKITAVIISLMDWLAPGVMRYVISSKPRLYPIVVAHEILRRHNENTFNDSIDLMLNNIRSVAVDPLTKNGWSWGLGFPWMSKNGLYKPDIPFVTHTPYIMEALLSLSVNENVRVDASSLFNSTWGFLQSLLVMDEDNQSVALSYAPIQEPRIVINANSYAALAYALHAVHGEKKVQDESTDRVTKLVNWIVNQQQSDGSWYYYADKENGNFIDCFHSCFVIKNLIKVKKLLPKNSERVNQSIQLGWSFLQNNFYDNKSGLCRRFVQQDIKDPFRWDLYDQAEYLGLLVDFGLYDEAAQFAEHVEGIFKKGENWYCKIDIFGRRWGKNFMRWGIEPFLYHKARLDRILNKVVSSCAE